MRGLRAPPELLSGVVALALGMLAVLSVLAMRFPAYLTTPELRAVYDVTTLRYLLFGGMVLAGALALTNIVLGRARYLSAWAFGFLGVAQLLGGPGTPIEDFPDHTPYLGLDFFVLDLLGSSHRDRLQGPSPSGASVAPAEMSISGAPARLACWRRGFR